MRRHDGSQNTDEAERLAVLLRLSRLIGGSLELSDVLQASIDGAVEVTGLDTGAIYLITGEELFLGATTPPISDDFPDALRRAPLDEHPHIRRALDGRAGYFIANLSEAALAPAERAAADARDLRSMLYVPLIADRKPVGIFLVGSRGRTAELPASDIDLCTTLASTISLAVANARLYQSLMTANLQLSRAYADELEHKEQLRALANDVTLAEERHRRELAVELNARVMRPLADLKRQLEVARTADNDRTRAESLTRAEKLVGEAVEQVGNIALEASPPYVFDSGLAPAVEWLCERTAAQGVTCEAFMDESFEDVSEDVRIFAFQATRELLSNVVKHAHAKHVTVTVSRTGAGLLVRVTDNGSGFPTSDLGKGGAARGFGLFSLGQRAKHLGGSLDVASSLGAGTIVSMSVPVAAESSTDVT